EAFEAIGEEDFDYGILDEYIPLNFDHALFFRFREPVPTSPKMADAHALPEPVISKRIAKIIQQLQVPGVQLFPALIKTLTGEVHKDFFLLHVHRLLSCLDRQNADFQEQNEMFFIDRLSLDDAVLDKIEQEERQIFVLEEQP